MIPPRADLRIWVATQPVDFRRGMDGLAALVATALTADPFGGDIFIFRSKRADRVKLLVWDGSGLVLIYKRLEAGRFTWPPIRDGVMALTPSQMTLLLDGHDWTRIAANVVRRPLRAA